MRRKVWRAAWVAVAALPPGGAAAEEVTARLERIEAATSAPIAERAAARDPQALPDGEVARGRNDVLAAWYAEPTRRYAHAVLGDAIEAGALVVESAEGRRLRVRLAEDQVFEDRYPRLVDLDGDGRDEIVVIRSSRREGAAVTVYGIEGAGASAQLVARAATPAIGRANRWLNIAGFGRFTGGDRREIAYIETPHIGGVLRLFALEGGALRQIAEAPGFSNHAIGARELRLSAVVDVDGDGHDELAAPSADRRRLRIVGLRDGAWRELASLEPPAPIKGPVTREGAGAEARLILPLETGAVYAVTFGK